jgi:hypothetical protein
MQVLEFFVNVSCRISFHPYGNLGPIGFDVDVQVVLFGQSRGHPRGNARIAAVIESARDGDCLGNRRVREEKHFACLSDGVEK